MKNTVPVAVEYTLMVFVIIPGQETEIHHLVGTATPREIATLHMQRSEVSKVLVVDDRFDAPYPILFDTAVDKV